MVVPHFQSEKKLMTVVHFNRVAMQRGQDEVWTVRNSEGCFGVLEVRFNTPMRSVFNKNGRQPRAKFKGLAKLVIVSGTAYLT